MTTGLKELFLGGVVLLAKLEASLVICFFAGGARSLGAVKSQAYEQSEKVRWLWAGLVLNIKVICGCSVKCLPSCFAGAVQAAFGMG